MDNFVVSARKYRPTGFAEVVGQEHITTTLKNAIDNNKLAQALLFCGPRGVGKTTCARIVARLINGFEEKAETNTLNIFELDAASNNSVEDIRNLIDQVRYPPQFGKFKVYIIDEVHMLSNAAFNAFLKTLEEPPPYAIFILATTEKHKVIPTILSRCQIFDFNRIQISDISNHLKTIAKHEGIKAEDEALHLIAQKADGALRDALSIFDLMVTYSSGKGITFKNVLSNLHILDYDYYFSVVEALLTQNHTQPLLILDEILKKGFDGQNFIVGLSEHIRNLLVSQDARTTQLMEVPENVKKKYAEQAQAAPPSLLLSWLNIANQCDINYKSSKNQRLSVELALMKMAHVQAVLDAAALPQQEAVKKKISDEPVAPQEPAEVTTPVTQSTPKIPELPKPANGNGNGTSRFSKQKSTPKIPALNAILNTESTAEEKTTEPVKQVENRPFTTEQLQETWKAFAEQRKKYKAEYQLLTQEFEIHDSTIVLHLMNPVQETLLNEMKSDLMQFIRERLQNYSIQVTGDYKNTDTKKVIYTNREKFEHLAEKNPLLLELKEKLGLDPDF
ncbi:MAG: DNA polymerase III subunit gamma/tau [Cyclobacteriaceae bacterium]|nr:DNA polymerase III subunit gamma/tau [Cyclobacteriaceae bacterium]